MNSNLPIERRAFLKASLAATATAGVAPAALARAAAAGGWQIAPFSYDVTPPIGHTMAGFGGPAKEHRDALQAIGYVLLNPDQPPIVVCVVDWIGINNAAHLAWRTALAEGAGTTPDRVAVHCVHQHDAPWACMRSHQLVAGQKDLAPMFDLDFFNDCLKRGRNAVKQALAAPIAISHVATGQAKVERVASSRRLRDKNGKFVWRGSGSRNPEVVALPEGKIDPFLRTLAFYAGDRKIVACHYYATHPMSQYGQGKVSSDFPGLARKRLQAAEPHCTHLYFTGCSGDVAAGKYNDGTDEARAGLIDRLHAGMVAAGTTLKREPIRQVTWRTESVMGDVNPAMVNGALASLVAGRADVRAFRVRPAMQLAWVERVKRGDPLVISALRINDATALHLPGEMFVEYQLRAQQIAPTQQVMVAAYGDGAAWYVPTADQYPIGGYEVSVAYNGPSFDGRMMEKIRALLA